jgi:serine/threonine protein kinase
MEADESNSVVKDASIELSALRDLKEKKAKNIAFMLDMFSFDAELWIIQEFCGGGSVHSLMKAREGGRLDEPFLIVIARELAEALRWVHSAGVIHRDIKGDYE